MATYIDKLSAMSAEDNEDQLANSDKEYLYSLLYGYEDFVIFTMNYRHTGIFDAKLARKCILHLFNNCDGIADIKQCCLVFVENIDNLFAVQFEVAELVRSLCEKYGNR